MGLFDVNEDVVQMTFEKAYMDAGGDVSKAESNPEVQQAVSMFAEEKGCSYNDAWKIAENPGKRLAQSDGKQHHILQSFL